MARPRSKYPTDSKLYSIRSRTLTKCLNSDSVYFKNFGAKGILVCDEWANSYEAFHIWSHSNGYEDGLTILRKDESKDFSPDNCYFGVYKKRTHGMSKTRQYNIRHEMINRCHNPKSSSFSVYGSVGIHVCKEWRESFENFWEWASNNGYSDYLTIDRINPRGNYEPSNCRWVSMHEQILNQERNKDRTADDKYIHKLDDGRHRIHITKSKKGKQHQVLAQTLETRDEAIMARDHFLRYGKKLNLKKIDAHIASMTVSPEEKKVQMLKRNSEKIRENIKLMREKK